MIANFGKWLLAVALILTGLYLAVFGNTWGPIAFEFLERSELGLWIELIVPFLPMVFIGFGATLFVSARKRACR
jgi:hypothetical protein